MPTSSVKKSKATKSKTSKSKTKKKAKPVDQFLSSIEVVKQQKKLKELQKSRKTLENTIKQIIETYNAKSSANKITEHFLDKLPLDSLRDFSEFSSGKPRETGLDILKIRTQLRKEKEIKEIELSKIESQIVEGQINVLLAKINFVINK